MTGKLFLALYVGVFIGMFALFSVNSLLGSVYLVFFLVGCIWRDNVDRSASYYCTGFSNSISDSAGNRSLYQTKHSKRLDNSYCRHGDVCSFSLYAFLALFESTSA